MPPVLNIDLSAIRKNAEILLAKCRSFGVEPYAVIKGYNAMPEITQVLVEAGYGTLASSRLHHLYSVKESGLNVSTLGLRVPMLSEAEDVVKACDISLNSERRTLRALDEAAGAAGLRHKVILMRDLGDLREGVMTQGELIELALLAEKLPNLVLYGIGTNLTCYGSVMPTAENLSVLAADAERIEKELGRPLDVVSGGETSTLPLMMRGELPRKINNLRIGEANIVPCDLTGHWNCRIEGLSNRTLTLEAEIIEIGSKPTHPIGKLDVNCFGGIGHYCDNGVRRRALLAIGAFDVGDVFKLIPEDPNIKILGGSSDHLIVDIEDCAREYRLGQTLLFTMHYQAMLFVTSHDFIRKRCV